MQNNHSTSTHVALRSSLTSARFRGLLLWLELGKVAYPQDAISTCFEVLSDLCHYFVLLVLASGFHLLIS
jgi:hypothetical protein